MTHAARPGILVLLLLAAPSALARTVHVVPAGDPIQPVINAASDGDAILLAAGTYTECLVFDGVQLAVYGASAGAVTTVSCTSALDAIEVRNGADVELADLSLRNSGGRGLYVYDATVRARGLDLRDHVSPSAEGGAILAYGGALRIADSVIAGSTASYGGGLFAQDSDVELTGVTLEGNDAAYGAGAYLVDGVAAVVGGSFAGNIATEVAGGLGIEGGTAELTDVAVWDNTASRDGGGLWLSTADARVSGGSFERNAATLGFGGGVYLGAGMLELVGATLSNNDASYGGALYALDEVEARATAFIGNYANIRGGALRINGGALTTWSCLFDANTTSTDGGHVAIANATWTAYQDVLENGQAVSSGGAIYADNSDVSLIYTYAAGGTADEGGAIYSTLGSLDLYGLVATGNEARLGGAIYASSTTDFSANGGLFELNSADVGGAVALYESSAQLDETEFRSNRAVLQGGAIAHMAQSNANALSVDTAIFEANEAAFGGALYAELGMLEVLYSRLERNIASSGGGGVYTYGLDRHEVHGNLFCANESDSDGGGMLIYAPFSTRAFYNNVFQENQARGYGGAAYEVELQTGATTTSDWSFDHFLGNVSTSTAYDGLAGNANTQLVYDSIFVGNDESGLGSVSGNGALYYGSVFWDHSAGSVTNTVDNMALFSNLEEDPLLVAWSADGDCNNDDLLPTRVYVGYKNPPSGVGAGVISTKSANVLLDFDGDGVTRLLGDCNDGVASSSPLEPEIPGNPRDENCDGVASYDADGDGFHSEADDCDDANPDVYPGAPEVYYDGVDADCDGRDDDDQDGDGSPDPTDCDDLDPSIHPGAADAPYDGVEASCDGMEYDADLDGWESDLFGGDDCDDTDDTVRPGVAEIWYDGFDQNCDGLDDYDADVDGHRSDEHGGDDCDDGNPDAYPGHEEVWYNGVDNDCDGGSDYDQDGDGYDYEGIGGTDCDDTDPTTYPGAEEIPDAVDNDCDGNSDSDSDGDGIIDYWESEFGTDPNGTDSDGDGLDDGVEWGDELAAPRDTDGDDLIDPLDTDSDGDGVPDAVEGLTDSDGDGLPDYRDDDDDDDGIPTLEEGSDDLDGDGIPNHLDTDSDGDGVLDAAEADDDNDLDGVPDYLDNGAGGPPPPEPPGSPEKYGFGCSSGPVAPSLGWLLAAAALRRRRDRRRQQGAEAPC
jgi:hypothetical protein